jgi:hypothetical protein
VPGTRFRGLNRCSDFPNKYGRPEVRYVAGELSIYSSLLHQTSPCRYRATPGTMRQKEQWRNPHNRPARPSPGQEIPARLRSPHLPEGTAHRPDPARHAKRRTAVGLSRPAPSKQIERGNPNCETAPGLPRDARSTEIEPGNLMTERAAGHPTQARSTPVEPGNPKCEMRTGFPRAARSIQMEPGNPKCETGTGLPVAAPSNRIGRGNPKCGTAPGQCLAHRPKGAPPPQGGAHESKLVRTKKRLCTPGGGADTGKGLEILMWTGII